MKKKLGAILAATVLLTSTAAYAGSQDYDYYTQYGGTMQFSSSFSLTADSYITINGGQAAYGDRDAQANCNYAILQDTAWGVQNITGDFEQHGSGGLIFHTFAVKVPAGSNYKLRVICNTPDTSAWGNLLW